MTYTPENMSKHVIATATACRIKASTYRRIARGRNWKC